MINIDLMEYASDSDAQAAYAPGSDIVAAGTATASIGSADGAKDRSTSDIWGRYPAGLPCAPGTYWWQINFGSAKTIKQYKIKQYASNYPAISAWTLQYYNGSSWVTADTRTGITSWVGQEIKTFTVSSPASSAIWRIDITAAQDTVQFYVDEFWMSGDFICYSEASIKTQGSYSLKLVATTAALNETLIRTIASPITLSGMKAIKFSIRASRTGSNVKVGFRDSGGTITEVTPNISTADTFQDITLRVDGVSNANKDAIDRIIFTVVNADAANTIYIDNIRAVMGSPGILFF